MVKAKYSTMWAVAVVNFSDGNYISLNTDGRDYYLYSDSNFVDSFKTKEEAYSVFVALVEELLSEKMGVNK